MTQRLWAPLPFHSANLDNDQAGETDSVYPLLPSPSKDKCCGSCKKPLARGDLVTALCLLLFHLEKDSMSRYTYPYQSHFHATHRYP